MEINDKEREFLRGTSRKSETIWNVVEILKAKPEDHQFCFDLALEMQNKDLVKLLYSLYPTKVIVELTLLAGDVAL
jgi:hypothetical protein